MTADHSSEQPASEESDQTPEQPMNRAERRAKGKGAAQAQAGGKAAFVPKKNASHGPRLWANRRAG